MICKYCKEEVKEGASICKHCGKKIPQKTNWKVILLCIGIMIFLFTMCSRESVKQTNNTPTSGPCWSSLEQTIAKEYLKSPTSSIFDKCDWADIKDTDGVTYMKVVGSVSSENSFGAMISSDFYCDIYQKDESKTGCKFN